VRVTNYWELPGLGTVYEIEGHGFTGPEYDGKPLYAYGKGEHDDRGRPKVGEYHRSLDRALVAAVGEKYTGPRGAGGTGVGTAADWFCRMVGMDALVEPDYRSAQKALGEVLSDAIDNENRVVRHQRTRAIMDGLEARGMSIAVRVDS
jgi:hypothetical protein